MRISSRACARLSAAVAATVLLSNGAARVASATTAPLYFISADTSDLSGQKYFLTYDLYGDSDPNAERNLAEVIGFSAIGGSVDANNPDVNGNVYGSLLNGSLTFTDTQLGGTANWTAAAVFGSRFSYAVRLSGNQFDGSAPITNGPEGFSLILQQNSAPLLDDGEGFGIAADLYRDHGDTDFRAVANPAITITKLTVNTKATASATYTGSGTQFWTTAAGWSTGTLPDFLTDVTLNQTATGFNLNTSGTAHNLTVAPGQIMLARGTTGAIGLTLAGPSFTNNGNASLGAANLRFLVDASITGTGTLTTAKTFRADGDLTLGSGQTVTVANVFSTTTSGTFDVADQLTVAGDLKLQGNDAAVSASTLRVDGTLEGVAPASGSFGGTRAVWTNTAINNGLIRCAGGNLTLGANTFTNNGRLLVSEDFLNLSVESTIHNGTIEISHNGAGKLVLNPDNLPEETPTVTGTGSWQIEGNLEYAYPASVTTTGVLTLGALGTVYVDAGAGGSVLSGSDLAGSGSFSIGAPVTINILNGDRTQSFSGNFGAGGTAQKITLNKSGAGTQLITSACPAVMDTNVTGGTLLVQNNESITSDNHGLGVGAVIVTGTGTLAGSGNIGTNLQATAGGTFAPGDGTTTGTFTTAFLTVGAGGHLRIKLQSANPATGFDHVQARSSVQLGGTLDLSTLGGYVPDYGIRHRILDVTAGTTLPGDQDSVFRTGHFATVTGNAVNADRWLAVLYDGTGVDVAAALPGDTDLDGHVNFTDLLDLAKHYGQGAGQTWSTADFDGNGAVNFTDLLALAKHYGQTVSSAATSGAFEADWALAQSLVPEPCVGVALLGLLGRRRRR